MSVRERKYKDKKTGKTTKVWVIDIDVYMPTGERKRIRKKAAVQTSKDARLEEIELRRQVFEGIYGIPVAKEKNFGEFATEFMTDHVNPGNKPSELAAKNSILRLHLLPFFGNMLLKEIEGTSINRFTKRQVEKGLSNKTVNNQLILLRTILGCALDADNIAKLPKIRKLKVPEAKIEFLSEDEASRLLIQAGQDSEWLAAISVALHCGLRLGELIALKWEDVDLQAGKLWVQRSDWQGHVGLPKSGKTRIIPLNDQVCQALRKHRHLRSEWIFTRPDGTRRNKDDFATALSRIRKRAGLRSFKWHLLRHTFASRLVSLGSHLRIVQELLGHASINMTLRYAHLSDADTRKAVDSLMGLTKQEAKRESSLEKLSAP